jgi:uncharacterized protein involved in outer membrane biogenesis
MHSAAATDSTAGKQSDGRFMDQENQETPFDSIAIAPDIEEEASVPEPVERKISDEEEDSSEEEPAPSEGNRESSKGLRWLRRIAVLLAGLYAIYILTGFVVLPYILRSILPHGLSVIIKRPVTIGSASFNPFTGKVVLQNSIIGPRLIDPEDTVDPLLSFSSCTIDLEIVSLVRGGIVCRSASLEHLFVHLVRQSDNTYNIMELLPSTLHAIPFSLNNFTVTDSRLLFDDLPAGKTHTVEEMSLALPTLSTFSYRAAEYIRPEFSAIVNGSPIKMSGETELTPDGVETRLQLQMDEVDLPSYLAYLPEKYRLGLSGGKGKFTAELIFSSAKAAEERLQIQGTASLADLRIQDEQGSSIVVIPELTLAGSVSPTAGQYQLQELICRRPEINLERQPDGRVVLPAFLTGWWEKQSEGSTSRVLSCDHFSVEAGRLSFTDRAVAGGHADRWMNMNATVKNYSSLNRGSDKQLASFEMSADHEDRNGALRIIGTVSASPMQLEGEIELQHLELAAYQPYIRSITVQDHRIKKGRADLAGHFTFAFGKEAPWLRLAFDNATVAVKDLQLASADDNWLVASALSGQRLSMSTAERVVDFGRIMIEDGEADLFVSRQGKILLGPPLPGEGQVRKTGSEKNDKAADEGWRVHLQSMELKRFGVRLINEKTAARDSATDAGTPVMVEKPYLLRLEDLSMQVADLASPAPLQWRNQIAATAVLGEGLGRLSCAGPLAGPPFDAQLDCSIKELEFARLLPLVRLWFQAESAGGILQAKGLVRLPAFSFVGDGELVDFTVSAGGRRILSWKKGVARQFDFSLPDLSLRIAGLDLEEPALDWRRQGNIDAELAKLLTLPLRDADQQKNAVLEVKKITVAGGKLTIDDLDAKPPYAATVTRIDGSIQTLTNQSAKQAHLAINGRVNDTAPLRLTGDFDFFIPQNNMNYELKVSGFNLVSLSPYLEPQFGSAVAGGQLDATINYKQERGRVQADNRLVIRDFLIEEKKRLDSNIALAAALLQNKEGIIVLNFQVGGDASDPSFSLRSGLMQALRSYQIKTAVSPFSLAKDLLEQEDLRRGDAVQLAQISFPFGKTELSDQSKADLQLLARVLSERPLLTLTIKGFVDARGDRDIISARLKKEASYRQIVEDIRLSEAFSKTYGKEEIAPSRPPESGAQAGAARRRESPVVKVTNEELVEMAHQRSQAVFQYLTDVLGVGATRLAVSDGGELIPADSVGRPGNRVDLVLGGKLSGQ